MPSVSITIIVTGYPSDEVPLMGVPQHQSPFVHGLTVGPTPNPLLLLRSTRFRRYDFPVLYKPATETTAMGPVMVLKKF